LSFPMAASSADWRAELERVLRDDETVLNLSNTPLGVAELTEIAELLFNSTVRDLWLTGNDGVESSEADARDGIGMLVKLTSVNATLERIFVNAASAEHPQLTIDAALKRDWRERGGGER
jgi:hypothetical protein